MITIFFTASRTAPNSHRFTQSFVFVFPPAFHCSKNFQRQRQDQQIMVSRFRTNISTFFLILQKNNYIRIRYAEILILNTLPNVFPRKNGVQQSKA